MRRREFRKISLLRAGAGQLVEVINLLFAVYDEKGRTVHPVILIGKCHHFLISIFTAASRTPSQSHSKRAGVAKPS